jgi:hypothetical protein
MTSYTLRYTTDRDAGVVHFTADDATTALVLAHEIARDRSGELWQGGHKVCTIDRSRARQWRPAWSGS